MTAPATPVKAAWWEDFIDVFTSPSKLFARRADGKFGHAFWVLVLGIGVLSVVTQSAMEPVVDAETARAVAGMIKSNPELPLEQARASLAIFAKFGPIIAALGTALFVPVLGVVILLIGKLFDAKLAFRSAVALATFAFFPRLLQLVVNAFQALLLDSSTITSQWSLSIGPARFLDIQTTSLVLMGFIGRIDSLLFG